MGPLGGPITYGPAVSLRGRKPIQFRPLDAGSGQFQNPPDLASLIKNPSLIADRLFGRDSSTIVVDPTTGDVPNTIRHEDIHAILDPLGDKASASDVPGYLDIARALGQAQKGGNSAFEAPAYIGSNDKTVKADPLVKAVFWKGYMHHIQSLDPKTAKQLQSFGPGVPPPGMEAGGD
jgi:hypothetical protein